MPDMGQLLIRNRMIKWQAIFQRKRFPDIICLKGGQSVDDPIFHLVKNKKESIQNSIQIDS